MHKNIEKHTNKYFNSGNPNFFYYNCKILDWIYNENNPIVILFLKTYVFKYLLQNEQH